MDQDEAVNLANNLSILRVVITVPLLVALLWSPPRWLLLAALLFAVAVISDVLDGYVARRQGMTSKFGVFLDLVADKFLTSSVLVALVDLGIIPTWPVAVILGREFIITGFRTFAAAEGLVIPAAAWGKQKTAVTNLAILLLILHADYKRGGATVDVDVLGGLFAAGPWLLYLAVLLTVTSGLMYLYAARGLFRKIPG